MPFQTLLPRAAYEMAPSYWSRLRWLFGFMYGLPMTVLILLDHRSDPLFGLGLGVSAGAVFGILIVWWSRRASKAAIDKAYRGDASVVAEPPPVSDYPWRLPCGYQLSPRRMVSGVLYLGCRDLVFKPNRRASRLLPHDVHTGSLNSLRFTSVPWVLGMFAKQLAGGRILIEVDGGQGVHRLEVPDPSAFLSEVALRQASCAGSDA